MAKKNKIKYESSSFDGDYKKVVITTIVVLAVLVVFYFITAAILNKDNTSTKDNNTETEIQYEEILVGTSFSMRDTEYLVVYYDMTDDSINTNISSAISTYKSSNKLAIYYVNMHDALNKQFVSDKSNSKATKASELAINGPTLIKFSKNKIVDYVEGSEKIVNYLK